MAKKVICNHAGGRECGECKHNKPHDANLFLNDRYGKITTYEGCVTHEGYCTSAIDGGAGDIVKCFGLER